MSEHESGSSDDEGRINEIVATKKPRRNVTYQRAARPTTYDDDDDDDQDEFNRQLRLKQTKNCNKWQKIAKQKVDPYGTVCE